MSKPRLIYFDFAGSRGEECRLALHIGGVDFEDVRIPGSEWPNVKSSTPFGAVPVLELPGKLPLSDSNAILAYIGREHGLHPKDNFQAAFHESLMSYVEDLRHQVGPSLQIKDQEQKRAAREELARDYLPTWGSNVEKVLGDHPFVGGTTISVVDLKLYMIVRWIVSGALDHIPTHIFDHCPKLIRIHKSVSEHSGVRSWLVRNTK